MAGDRFDLHVERAEVQALDKLPHEAGAVIRRQQAFEVDRPQFELHPVRPLYPWFSASRFDGRLVPVRQRKEGLVHTRSVAAPTGPVLRISSQARSRGAPRPPTFGAPRHSRVAPLNLWITRQALAAGGEALDQRAIGGRGGVAGPPPRLDPPQRPA